MAYCETCSRGLKRWQSEGQCTSCSDEYESEDCVRCPHCGEKRHVEPECFENIGDEQCHECGHEFAVEIEYTVTLTSPPRIKKEVQS
ncbi:hypothetical protein Pla110_44050 [Polystyrenella longa]|uniref:Uncharacterized protein n=1 Tax=Polystyrenella longa TaxID=2528007 RepID=A0A518CTY6_9PLAN|nr:hypothetical protein Pla110_44050 [Polystyrenella longa]